MARGEGSEFNKADEELDWGEDRIVAAEQKYFDMQQQAASLQRGENPYYKKSEDEFDDRDLVSEEGDVLGRQKVCKLCGAKIQIVGKPLKQSRKLKSGDTGLMSVETSRSKGYHRWAYCSPACAKKASEENLEFLNKRNRMEQSGEILKQTRGSRRRNKWLG